MFNLQIKKEDAAKRTKGVKFKFYLVEFLLSSEYATAEMRSIFENCAQHDLKTHSASLKKINNGIPAVFSYSLLCPAKLSTDKFYLTK